MLFFVYDEGIFTFVNIEISCYYYHSFCYCEFGLFRERCRDSMEVNMLLLLRDLMYEQRIETRILKAPYENIKYFDSGLRNQLYEAFDYNEIIWQLENNCKDNRIYMVTDQFSVNYIIFKVPSMMASTDATEYFLLGPYMMNTDFQNSAEIIERNRLPLYHISELQEYYSGIPVLQENDVINSILNVMMKYIFGGDDFQVDCTGISFYMQVPEEFKIENEKKLSMTLIEERYRFEDELLEAIEKGDYQKTIKCSLAIGTYRMKPRSSDDLRNLKNLMIVLNALIRKAVQKAKVHPVHIDSISDSFAKRIESCINESELLKINKEMLRKYCLLVQNHSLMGYSLTIQNAINYIDFNLSEPLTLMYLSEKLLVSSSYLSAQFKKETGKTLTDYINNKRIQRALILLSTTDLRIQSIAEKVGIFDESYFSRLFKKEKNITAREYRNIMKGN